MQRAGDQDRRRRSRAGGRERREELVRAGAGGGGDAADEQADERERPRGAAQVRVGRRSGTGRRVRKASAVLTGPRSAARPSSRTAMRMCSASRPRSSVGRTAMPLVAQPLDACRPGPWPGRSSRRRDRRARRARRSCGGEPRALRWAIAVDQRRRRAAGGAQAVIAASARPLTGHAWRRRVQARDELRVGDQVARAQPGDRVHLRQAPAGRGAGPPGDARLRVRDEVHEALVHEQRAAGAAEAGDRRCVWSVPVGLHGLVTNSRSMSSGTGGRANGVALRCRRRGLVPVGACSAAAGSPNAGVMIALRVVGGVARGEQPEPLGGAVEHQHLLGRDVVLGRDRAPRGGLVRVRPDRVPRLLDGVGQPLRRRPGDDVDREVRVAGADQLVPVDGLHGSSSARPATTSTTRSAALASAWLASPSRSSQRRVRASAGTGLRPASSATTTTARSRGRERGRRRRARSLDSARPVECAVAVHHAGDPHAEAVEQDGPLGRASRARRRPRSSSTRGRGGPGGRRCGRASRRRSPRRWRGTCRRRAALPRRALAAAAAAEDEGQAHAS